MERVTGMIRVSIINLQSPSSVRGCTEGAVEKDFGEGISERGSCGEMNDPAPAGAVRDLEPFSSNCVTPIQLSLME